MILPDVNVLIYAFRADNDHHAVCRAWLEAVVSGDARFGIAPPVLSAVVRITTDRRIYEPKPGGGGVPLLRHASRAASLSDVEPGERHWDLFRRLCLETNTQGSRVTDAWFAALAIEWGCEWVTMDCDYARFPGLRWATPAAKPPRLRR